MNLQVENTVMLDFAIRECQMDDDLNYFLAMQFESAKENRVIDLSKPEDELKQAHRAELLQFIEGKQNNVILIATNMDEERVGYIWIAERGYCDPWDFENFSAWIYDVRVAPAWRGHGLGKRLVLQAEQAAQRKGFERIGLHVFAFNEVARRIYDSVGYQVVNRHFKKQITLAAASKPDAVCAFDPERHLDALMVLWYANYSDLAHSQGATAEDQIRARFEEYTRQVDFANPKVQTWVLENQAGELVGFSRITKAKSDLNTQEMAWITAFEVTSSCYHLGLAKQLLTQNESWANQQGLTSIQTGIYTKEHLVELLGSSGYQETSLFMQKRLTSYQVT